MDLTSNTIERFKQHLIEDDKAPATVDQYVRSARMLTKWLDGREVKKKLMIEYRASLIERYEPSSVNTYITGTNSFLGFCKKKKFRLKAIKIQKNTYRDEAKNLTLSDYKKMKKAAKEGGFFFIYYVMTVLFTAGLRISELEDITVEAVKKGYADVTCKGKTRRDPLPKELCNMLRLYIKNHGIKRGAIFKSKKGTPISRSTVNRHMKKIAAIAGVALSKVFPHNLRHLFAQMYYEKYKDIAKLADILGHSSIDTTRLYIMDCGEINCRRMEDLGLWKY